MHVLKLNCEIPFLHISWENYNFNYVSFYVLGENPSFTLSIGMVHGQILDIYFYATNIMDVFGTSSTIVGVWFFVGLGFSTIKMFYIKIGDQQG